MSQDRFAYEFISKVYAAFGLVTDKPDDVVAKYSCFDTPISDHYGKSHRVTFLSAGTQNIIEVSPKTPEDGEGGVFFAWDDNSQNAERMIPGSDNNYGGYFKAIDPQKLNSNVFSVDGWHRLPATDPTASDEGFELMVWWKWFDSKRQLGVVQISYFEFQYLIPIDRHTYYRSGSFTLTQAEQELFTNSLARNP